MIGVGREGPLGVAMAAGDGRRDGDGPAAGSSGAAPAASRVAPAASPPSSPKGSPHPDRERDALTVLATVEGLGPMTLGRLRAALGSASAIVDLAGRPGGAAAIASASRDLDGRGLATPVADGIVAAIAAAGPILRRIRALDLSVVTLDDAGYPDRLRAIELPPHVLFVRGNGDALNRPRAVAVVGTRRPTDGGRALAGQVSAGLVAAGAAVVSGLAIGVDGAAHDAAVKAGGTTVAVLGSGHDRLVPAAHRGLANRIVEAGGAVVSEFAPAATATRGTFPRRNRVISGLSEATVVVEAGARSGALITADWALQQGRGCFLVPGRPDDEATIGCLAFLREAHGEARLFVGVDELIEDLGLTVDPTGPIGARASLADLGAVERTIAAGLAGGARTVDALVAATGLATATVLGALTLLELRGIVTSAYGRYQPAGALLVRERRR